MDTARQALRFSIPGTITIVLAGGFLVLGRLLQGDSWDGIASTVREYDPAVIATVVVIPLGFVIYQIYDLSQRPFIWPWPWRWARDRPWVRIDRGAQVLRELPVEVLERIEATFGVRLEADRPVLHEVTTGIGKIAHAYEFKGEYVEGAAFPYERYKRRCLTHWHVVNALVEISEATDAVGSVKAEYASHLDLYGALGACRTGVALAWSTSTYAALGYAIAGGSYWGSLLTISITLLFAAVLGLIFHRSRGNAWTLAQGMLSLRLTGLFNRRPDLLGPQVVDDRRG